VGHTEQVFFVTFSPDGQRIVTTGADYTARVWDAETTQQLAVLRKHTGNVLMADFSADGERIVTASIDHTARVWSRRRLEYWWGIAWLPEFWVAFVSGGALLVIAARNLRRRKATMMEAS
jgi:WD40 repeat protein